MIRFGNLLQYHNTFSLFWKTVLERLSIEDAPFLSSIKNTELRIDDRMIELTCAPNLVADFCREQWLIPLPLDAWKDIKKEHVRIFLLQDYLALKNLEPENILRIQMLVGDKTIGNEDIVLQDGRIVDIKGLDNYIEYL